MKHDTTKLKAFLAVTAALSLISSTEPASADFKNIVLPGTGTPMLSRAMDNATPQ